MWQPPMGCQPSTGLNGDFRLGYHPGMAHDTLFLTAEAASAADSRPSEFVTEVAQDLVNRLKILSVFTLGIWLFYLGFFEFVAPRVVVGFDRTSPYHPMPHLLGAGLALVMGIVAKTYRGTCHSLLVLGLVFGTLTAGIIGYMNVEALESEGWKYHGVSWVALWILIYATTVPAPPKKMLVWGFVTASIEPVLAAIRMHDSAMPHGSLLSILPFFKESYISAILAVVPARLIQNMSQRVREARELGSYRLSERIGQGGMGEVWRAEHRLLARPAAVKLIRPEKLEGRDAGTARTLMHRFEREARATAALESPHSIELFDFGIDQDGTFYYVMELLNGFDLDTLVREFGPLPAERVAQVLWQAAHSLEDAHARGLIHRDVKPANIFLCRKGQDYDFVKVLDFGLVLTDADEGEESARLTRQGMTTGTPAFMAPEQAAGTSVLDHRADLYALGCVGYWLLTGQLVFTGRSALEIAAAHLRETPVPPSKRTETPVPEALDHLILQCLEKDPGARPGSAGAIRDTLEASGLLGPWTPGRAREWWLRHAPARVGV